uniref:Signal peptidase complex subunit 2 n=1 Tax=Rhodosorus marinus TaxID=101924 RepID=A0A7S0BDC9_9RHOD|mmetsp:Transcript_11435/g.16483  ORF Transcript_11435/g.16483 Transcript_11435/m.16483 type:complete len:206 (+) Transcript_11435:103-720(+)
MWLLSVQVVVYKMAGNHEEGKEQLVVDKLVLHDTQFVKKHLDDFMMKVLKSEGYEESNLLVVTNFMVTSIAVAAAVCSHFVLKDFKTQQHLMILCIAIWMVCSLILGITERMYGASFSGASYIGFSDPKRMGTAPPFKFICATSTLPKYSQEYMLKMTPSRSRKPLVERNLRYNDYYTSNGQFLKEKFESQVKKAIQELISAKTK